MAEGTIHPISDAGRRMSEGVAIALQRGGEGRWLAVDMETGKARDDIYDSKADAIRLNDESRHCYVMIPPTGMPPAEATHWIDLHRRLLAQGWKMTDPGAPTPIPNLSPTATGPRPGRRPSGLIVPDLIPRRKRPR